MIQSVRSPIKNCQQQQNDLFISIFLILYELRTLNSSFTTTDLEDEWMMGDEYGRTQGSRPTPIILEWWRHDETIVVVIVVLIRFMAQIDDHYYDLGLHLMSSLMPRRE